MIKRIENLEIKNYNNIILGVNKCLIAESDNPYGHTKEFNKLDNNTKLEAYRVNHQSLLDWLILKIHIVLLI